MMSEGKGLSQGVGLGIGGVAVAAIVVIAAYFGGVLAPEEVTDIASAPAPDVASNPQDNTAEETTDPTPTTEATDAAPEEEPTDVTDTPEAEDPDTSGLEETPQSAEVEPADDPTVQPVPPSIDTFRLAADGQLLISGRTTPGWETSILLDREAIHTASPDSGGQFAEFLTLEFSDQPRVLSLSMRNGDDVIASVEEVIIAPTPKPAADEGVDPDAAIAALDDDESGTPEASASAADDTAPSQTVLLSNEAGVTVLQAPQSGQDGPELLSDVALDAVTYSDQGKVQISGRAQGDGHVRVYLDNTPISTTQIAEDGNWRSDLPEVDAGTYTLRVDQLDEEGNVTSRVEAPFTREGDVVLAELQTGDNQTQITAVTVVEGSTLWAISRAAYGEGILYVRVFEANRELIRDPDLIFPGQVFTIPQ